MIGCQCERWGVNIAIDLNYKIYKCMMLVQWYSARQNAGNKSEKKDAKLQIKIKDIVCVCSIPSQGNSLWLMLSLKICFLKIGVDAHVS